LISGVRSLFVDKKCTVIFHTPVQQNTRPGKRICGSLDMADEVILLPIYPQENTKGRCKQRAHLNNMQLPQKQILDKDTMIDG